MSDSIDGRSRGRVPSDLSCDDRDRLAPPRFRILRKSLERGRVVDGGAPRFRATHNLRGVPKHVSSGTEREEVQRSAHGRIAGLALCRQQDFVKLLRDALMVERVGGRAACRHRRARLLPRAGAPHGINPPPTLICGVGI